MEKQHLSIDDFFVRLANLFSANLKKGSIFLTQKRLSPPSPVTGQPDDLSDLTPPAPLPVLIRATNGKNKEQRQDKIKISTVVQPEQLEAFYARYAETCKNGMTGLKKRDRSGQKAKARAKARKRKEAEKEADAKGG